MDAVVTARNGASRQTARAADRTDIFRIGDLQGKSLISREIVTFRGIQAKAAFAPA